MPTVEVDVNALKDNISYIKNKIGKCLCAVVKANAYGHGLTGVAQCIENDVDLFAVATVNEAETLVQAGIVKDIIVLGNQRYVHKLAANIIPTVCNEINVHDLFGLTNRISIAVNTGMNRIGCEPNKLKDIFFAAKNSGMEICGIFTHLYNETDIESCKAQLSRFNESIKPFIGQTKLHCCASNCLLLPDNFYFDTVRVGLAMYGYGYENLKPVMKVYAPIIQINEIKRGEHIGYGTFTATSDMTIATVRLGYGDGFRRIDNAYLSVNGTVCKVVGNICMDICMTDVTSVDCKVGDRAYFLGENITMSDLCNRYNTISHEVLTMINERAKRVYVEK